MPSLAATEQDVYPPRVLLSLTGLTVSDAVRLYREVAGTREEVRGAGFLVATDTSVVVVDAELPFGVPVTYVAEVNETEYPAGPYTFNLADGATSSKPVLTDAITALAAEAVIVAWPGKKTDRDAVVLRLATGKNAAVVGPAGQFVSTLELFTESQAARDNLVDVLQLATAGTVQLRQGGGYAGVDSYLAVLSYDERRFSQDGTDARRLWTLDVAEVDPWAEGLEARGYTLQDVGDAYTGLTMANYGSDYATILAAAQADYS